MAKEKSGKAAPKKAAAKAVAPKKKSTTKSTAKNKSPKSKAKGKKASKQAFSAKVKGAFVTVGNKVVNFGKASKAVVAGRLRALADVIDSDK